MRRNEGGKVSGICSLVGYIYDHGADMWLAELKAEVIVMTAVFCKISLGI